MSVSLIAWTQPVYITAVALHIHVLYIKYRTMITGVKHSVKSPIEPLDPYKHTSKSLKQIHSNYLVCSVRACQQWTVSKLSCIAIRSSFVSYFTADHLKGSQNHMASLTCAVLMTLILFLSLLNLWIPLWQIKLEVCTSPQAQFCATYMK